VPLCKTLPGRDAGRTRLSIDDPLEHLLCLAPVAFEGDENGNLVPDVREFLVLVGLDVGEHQTVGHVD
jgi:hypothetical protein